VDLAGHIHQTPISRSIQADPSATLTRHIQAAPPPNTHASGHGSGPSCAHAPSEPTRPRRERPDQARLHTTLARGARPPNATLSRPARPGSRAASEDAPPAPSLPRRSHATSGFGLDAALSRHTPTSRASCSRRPHGPAPPLRLTSHPDRLHAALSRHAPTSPSATLPRHLQASFMLRLHATVHCPPVTHRRHARTAHTLCSHTNAWVCRPPRSHVATGPSLAARSDE